MTDIQSPICDDDCLYRFIDGELAEDEHKRFTAHLEGCRKCRRQLAVLTGVAQRFRDRVQTTSDAVDFTSLEKSVLNRALRQRHSRGGSTGRMAVLRYMLPAAVTAGMLLFVAYTYFPIQPKTAPSAIINSFTGSMSSVMIFETPDTRQTILWYTEDTDAESEPNAV